MYDDTGRFIDNDDIVVFKDHIKGDRLREWRFLFPGRRRNRQSDLIPGLDLVTIGPRNGVDENPAPGVVPLDLVSREFLDARGTEHVEPEPLFIGADDKPLERTMVVVGHV
jgi:hypothetical protein